MPRRIDDFEALSAMPPVAEARFVCARHGTEAGVVRLRGSESAGWLASIDHCVAGSRQRVAAPSVEPLLDALARADARAIHALRDDWAPFYCARCDASYCVLCWRAWPVFNHHRRHEEIRGACPEGHERFLEE